uniref:Uncharacterized protein n=1 Tax=Anguilla anguilla TaxID=7936 RepID=A0A0E9VQ15_ANGAN
MWFLLEEVTSFFFKAIYMFSILVHVHRWYTRLQ